MLRSSLFMMVVAGALAGCGADAGDPNGDGELGVDAQALSASTLAAATDGGLCANSGGTWSGSCECASGMFVPGVGGCTDPAVGSEDGCDETGGSYTDDDSTRIGTFCRCGVGRYMTEGGCTD